MAITPYYTSTDIINSVKRKISFPISQQTFTENDILAFANEEMFISQVPSVLQFHQDFFTTYKTIPLRSNVSRYAIPDRATGMKLRDLFYQDNNGNLYEMSRVQEDDRAYFQANTGSNQAAYTFFVQGNDIILTPGVASMPTGSLIFVFFLRPNQLVKNDRAATITGFSQNILINNSLISPLDTISITSSIPTNPGVVGSNPSTILPDIFTAVSTLGGSISAITAYSTIQTQITTSAPHQLSQGQFVVITSTDSNPLINGTFPVAQIIDANNFLINKQISVVGTTGSFTCLNQFQIGVSNNITASNLNNAFNAVTIENILGSTVITATVTLSYADVRTIITTTNTVGFIIPQESIGIEFSNLNSTYLDQETNIVEPLFVNKSIVDFLQTRPGHRTYTYDIEIPATGISGNTVTFLRDQLLVPTGTILNSTSQSGTFSIAYELPSLIIGDYMCLANEAIIPQIPPDLHNGLAERTAARILAAMGDQQGLQASMTKIAEIDAKQGNLLDNRVEGNPLKILNRHSPLRMGKMGRNRRL